MKVEPYSFQRQRNAVHSSYPRPPQPNISQPNQKPKPVGWGETTKSYWQGIFDDYLKRKK